MINNELIADIVRSFHEQGKKVDSFAFGYCRVSTQRQSDKGYSREDQERAVAEYASREGLAMVYIFSAAESAFHEGREQFNTMIDLALQCSIKMLYLGMLIE
jgi:hypothetical protein